MTTTDHGLVVLALSSILSTVGALLIGHQHPVLNRIGWTCGGLGTLALGVALGMLAVG